MYLASQKGRRLLNIMYSWGAAVVIIGALFKLLHLPFGNQMLFIGMITEFLVFFISGLEQPEENYHWEQVFPELLSINPLDRKEMEDRRKYLAKKAAEARKKYGDGTVAEKKSIQDNITDSSFGHQEVEEYAQELQNLDQAINQLNTLSKMGSDTANDLNNLIANIGPLSKETSEYTQRLKDLNQSMLSLQTLYENQLRDITNQVSSIEKINLRLDQICRNYDDGLNMSQAFRHENTMMLNRIHDLNTVYARLLEAMTVNMANPLGSMNYSSYRSEFRTNNTGAFYTNPDNFDREKNP